jgi:hypothetical protein
MRTDRGALQKHAGDRDSETPKPQEGGSRELSVAKKPLANLPAERRAEIALSVLTRYINGEQVAAMAPEYGVSDVTIYALLLREHEDDWKEVQRARALARLERSQEELKTAPDALSLARAREQVRSAQWELERLLRRLYGQDAPAHTGQAVSINIHLGAAKSSLVDGQVIDIPVERN